MVFNHLPIEIYTIQKISLLQVMVVAQETIGLQGFDKVRYTYRLVLIMKMMNLLLTTPYPNPCSSSCSSSTSPFSFLVLLLTLPLTSILI